MEHPESHNHTEHEEPDFDLELLTLSQIERLLEACGALEFRQVEDALFRKFTEYQNAHPGQAITLTEELSTSSLISSRLFAATDIHSLFEISPDRLAAVAQRLLMDEEDEVVTQALTSVRMVEEAKLLDLQRFAVLHEALLHAHQRVEM